MMDDELRQAMGRVRATLRGNEIGVRIPAQEAADLKLVAGEYMKHARTDDGEMLTPEWVTAVIPPDEPTDKKGVLVGNLNMAVSWSKPKDKPMTVRLGGDILRYREMDRGSFRTLCRVLGIELKESQR